jgi:maltose alpha-D-glucosyltransferase / alpha-amylase
MARSDHWYKNAVIYCLDVDTFQDGNGDGEGDFRGLTDRLDYLDGLGITCIWLLPFFPSPDRDNGYDVMDYYNVDPRLGTLGDFVEFLREADERGIRVISDLVVNHTSDQHPWFQQARRDRNSKYRNFYIWNDDPPDDTSDETVFPGEQHSIWTYDEQAGSHYLHRFYDHQPELNIENPAVRDEILKIMGYWLQLGISGFRLDAAPYLIDMRGINENGESNYAYLEEFRRFLDVRRGNAIMIAEANVEPKKKNEYFGVGNRMQMVFNFYLNQYMFLALARQSAKPLIDALKKIPPVPTYCQWANFVRNHDELTLDKLTKKERQEVFRAFGPEEHMQIFNRGIRRRYPPMVDGDPRRIKLAYSLMLTLPGTPVLWNGEEIGMGDDLSLEGRNSVRTSMQWSDEPNGGFSTAAAEDLYRPVISKGAFGYKKVNIAQQERDPNSLLNWMEHAIRVRKLCPEFGWGEWEIIKTGDAAVLAHCCTWHEGRVMAVHNLSYKKRQVELNLRSKQTRHVIDLLGDSEQNQLRGPIHRLTLKPYDCRWFRLEHTDGYRKQK